MQASNTDINTLEIYIRNLIKREGDLPLDKFLSIVIEYYYKNNTPIGKKGDFITAPEVSQMFGEIIGIWCANHWIKHSKPKFALVEMGAGYGTMMKDLLRATTHVKGFHEALEYIYIVEISDYLIGKQKNNLKEYENKLKWVDSIADIQNENVLFVTNEFFDALPTKQFIKRDGDFYEVMVGINSKKRLSLYASDHKVDFIDNDCPQEGIIEFSLASMKIAKQIANKLDSKFSAALIIDYGYEHKSYISSLQAVKDHQYTEVLEDIGHADITYHVDFSSLQEYFSTLQTKLSTQGDFLITHGIYTRAEQLIRNGANPETIQNELSRLTGHEQMGALFKVLEVYRSL